MTETSTQLKIHAIAIVNFVEAELLESRPCPLCGLYTGGHQAHCPYLFFWSWKHEMNIVQLTPEEGSDLGGQTSQSNIQDADVVSADETSLPAPLLWDTSKENPED